MLAAGTSIPDAMESIIVARMNMADMARIHVPFPERAATHAILPPCLRRAQRQPRSRGVHLSLHPDMIAMLAWKLPGSGICKVTCVNLTFVS